MFASVNTLPAQSETICRGQDSASSPLRTTLYDLIAAMQTGTAPEDDAAVVTTIAHWLRSGRLSFLGDAGGVPAALPL